MLLDLLFTLLLVFLNGFFVAAEFSLVKVRSSQLDLKIQKGSKRAKTAKNLTEKLDSTISATQLGITLSSLGLGWVGEDVVANLVKAIFLKFDTTLTPSLVHSISIPVAFALITFLHIVLGEQIPKMVGIKFSLQTSMLIALPLRIFYFVFRPFIWLLHKSSGILLRLLGIKGFDDEVHTEEELRLILTESEEGGAIKPSENELIQNVFDFDDRIVKQILVPTNRVVALDVEIGRDEMIKQIIEEGFSRMPVYLGDIDNVIGIVHSKDLLKAVVENRFKTIKDIMRSVHFVPESMKVNELLRDLQKHHIQMAVVTNERGATAGIITMEDIIEELVGEIQDEHDEEKPDVEKKSDTEFIVNAQSSMVDVNNALPVALPESPHYETVSGYVNYVFGRIPPENDKRIKDGYEITILKRNKQNVESIRLKIIK
ncbi:MAG TPA: hemolysin family protein [Bacteroidia bacterium]|jgi:CBS domain containing-hemolysin-like protein|nr:hemolysin family protein [Bacteroidia bacterium]